MSINLGAPKSNDDEYYTPQYAIEMLKDYLPDKPKCRNHTKWRFQQYFQCT